MVDVLKGKNRTLFNNQGWINQIYSLEGLEYVAYFRPAKVETPSEKIVVTCKIPTSRVSTPPLKQSLTPSKSVLKAYVSCAWTLRPLVS